MKQDQIRPVSDESFVGESDVDMTVADWTAGMYRGVCSMKMAVWLLVVVEVAHLWMK